MARSPLFPWLSGSAAALAVAVALVLILIDWAGRTDGVGARYNLIVLTVESLRSDAVNPETTPRLLALVEERAGLHFRNHRSVSAWTVPNIVALLSGTHPVRQGIISRGQSLRGVPWNRLTASDGLEFPVFSFQPFALINSYDRLGLVREPGGAFPLALAGMARRDRPTGLWYHYLDTHLPHQPTLANGTQPAPEDPSFDTALGLPPSRDSKEAARRRAVASQPSVPVEQMRFLPSDRHWIDAYYLSEVRAFDRWFERFFDIFVRTGLFENTVLIVTADHGEELGEAGRVGHASTTREAVLNDAVLNVPLFIWTPDARHRSALRTWADSGTVTDHVDLGGSLPTLIGATTVSLPDDGLPRDLKPRDLTGPVETMPRYALTSAAGFAESDPTRTEYFLLSREGRAGDRETLRLGWPDISQSRARAPDGFLDIASALILPDTQGRNTGVAGDGRSITWIWPQMSGDIHYSEIQHRNRIEWAGAADERYVLEYAAGTGAMRLAGEIEVLGNAYTFGLVDREYWDTFVVPYDKVRFRVRSLDTGAASEWLTVRLR